MLRGFVADFERTAASACWHTQRFVPEFEQPAVAAVLAVCSSLRLSVALARLVLAIYWNQF